ncbi:TPA: fimbrial protein [Salmonella enterica subsp. enterica serovar Muenchen]|nr:fimbrial protein [Salmonella enterica]EHX6758354.1 fimbrial protein [Salmonella enterica subsp. enterica serovar Chester]EHZ1826608.1 fimbrial protein [Salmonella enterica subsp. enterica serovar Chester]HEC8685146.1 fimbrial protein [Salmonella enterica subsp. enterica serovar Oranienburg]
MKKYAIALSALSLAVLSGTASASKGDIYFLGAVSDATCDLGVSVGGVVNNTIQLGTTQVNTESTPVKFELKPVNPTAGGCDSLDNTNNVHITFGAYGLSNEGLPSQSGQATDAYVKVFSENSSEAADNNIHIKQGSETRKFKGDVIKSDGAKFKASLMGGAEKGDYHSALAFAVTYM